MNKKYNFIIAQRNRFLEDLGLKPSEYGVNWTMRCDRDCVGGKWKAR